MRICSGNHNTALSGISIARIDIAPAGGMYILTALINNITHKIVIAETTYNGNSQQFMQKMYRSPAPNNAHTVISATDFTGVPRAFEFGLVNSVNATKSGGATINRKSKSNAGMIITTAKSVLHSTFLYSLQCGFGSGENSLSSRTFPFSKAIRHNKISAVSITADTI